MSRASASCSYAGDRAVGPPTVAPQVDGDNFESAAQQLGVQGPASPRAPVDDEAVQQDDRVPVAVHVIVDRRAVERLEQRLAVTVVHSHSLESEDTP